MSGDEFRRAVLERDGHRCVICGSPAVDAFHIVNPRLFVHGGDDIGNGASLCADHRLACERTDICVEDVRRAAGITRRVVPSHLHDDQAIDRYGNPVLPNGSRLRGELFEDASVRDMLCGHLHEFSSFVKYPRTPHLARSPGLQDDDRRIASMDAFEGQRVIVTLKMDGEQTTMYTDYIHARSIDSRHHVSRDWVKSFWSSIAHDIPVNWRVCGENLFARHAIAYEELPSYFLGFSIWNERNECLDWDETAEWFRLLGIVPVPLLYDGPYDEDRLRALERGLSWDRDEGYVIRTAGRFGYAAFQNSVAKWVRKGHVRTTKHWMTGQAVVPNGLRASQGEEDDSPQITCPAGSRPKVSSKP